MAKVVEIQGDVFSVKNALIVHGCNAFGVMGGGVAAIVSTQYVPAYEVYRKEYQTKGLKLGTCTYAYIPEKDFYIVNAVTQFDFGAEPDRVYVNYEAVEAAFTEVVEIAKKEGVTNIAFPLIGCGLAKGKWPAIKAIIEKVVPNEFSCTLYFRNEKEYNAAQ